MKHLVIIDGMSFFFRAYHAVRPLNRADGLPTNALYGFSQMLVKLLNDLKPDYCAVALESKGPTFRKEMFEAYKAHRSEPDEEMRQQFPYFEPMVEAFSIKGVGAEGYEADDVIATLVKKYKSDVKITILSSDKDLYQLIDDQVTMLDTMKDRQISFAEVEEKFGVGPDKVIEVQALIGDSADNIPGVKGIGPKGAATLIQKYGSLDSLYDNLDELKGKQKENLETFKDEAYLSYKLVTLEQDAPVQESLEELDFEPNLDKVIDFLNEMEFTRLAQRLAGKSEKNIPAKNPEKKHVETTYTAVQSLEELEKWISRIKDKGYCAIDTETTSLNAHTADLVGISLAIEEHEACYIPLTHLSDIFNPVDQLDKVLVLEKLKPLLTDENIRKVGQNIKYDMLIFLNEGILLKGVEDTMVMSAVLHAGLHNHSMDALAEKYLDHKCISYKEVCGTGQKQITFDQVPIDKATAYAAEDADITLRLYHLFKDKLDKEPSLKELYISTERPLISVLTKMEHNGVLVDREALEKLSVEFGEQIKNHEQAIYDLAGEEFNISSPKQLGDILFGKLGIEGAKKTKTGFKTDVSVLEKLEEEGYEIARLILEYRQLSKLKSTYADALVKDINPKTGRVHTSYHQNGAGTGRMSSSDPNLQNIPIRTENGKRIRQAFIADKDKVIMAADYSQIELRLLAHASGSEALQKAFNEGFDIHRFTASQIFGVEPDAVTSEQRRASKAINFGIVYGMGAFSLSKQIGVSTKEAKAYIDAYFERYSGVKPFMDKTIEDCKEKGYVETIFGRRNHIPNINSSNGMMRSGAERAAINAPLQGANADIIKRAMRNIQNRLEEENLETKMLMQVHDELVFEVPQHELEKAKALVLQEMESVTKLSVPLSVGIDIGDNWQQAH